MQFDEVDLQRSVGKSVTTSRPNYKQLGSFSAPTIMYAVRVFCARFIHLQLHYGRCIFPACMDPCRSASMKPSIYVRLLDASLVVLRYVFPVSTFATAGI